MKDFMERLNDYFARTLKKHYISNDKRDHEQNHTFNFFLDLLEYMPKSPQNRAKAGETLIFHQYHLTQELGPLNKGKIPDLLMVFIDYHQKKHIVFVEFWFLFIVSHL